MSRHYNGGHVRSPWSQFRKPGGLSLLTALLLLMATQYHTAHAASIKQISTNQTSANQTAHAAPINQTSTTNATLVTSNYHVPVTLYVMSRCPDTKFCQSAFKPVLEALSTVATVRTEYVAKLTQGDRVTCKHGPTECEGNKQQQCLQHQLAAPSNNKKFFQALLCHTNSRVKNITQLQACMTEAGVSASDQTEVVKCVNGTLGTALAVESAKTVAANSVEKSCTVFINGAKRCIRDRYKWYDCPGGSDTHAFMKTICDAYKTKIGSPAAECVAALGQQ